jgi:sterol-4alpha-carboxylate 3-dehydrogenase (decarboxylating)
MSEIHKPNVLITGGAGFLGRRIVKEILAGDSPVKPASVTVLDIKEFRGDEDVLFINADIRDRDAVRDACKGKDLVIHAAAIVDWGTIPDDEVWAINYTGTENVVEACKENKVPHLVYTGSLDAVYTGTPLRNIDDGQPYPETFQTMYCKTKARAEQLVKESDSDELKTVVLRPSDIYGEEDPYHMDSLINMAKSGFYVKLGNGSARTQHVYVGNIAHAHLLAAKELMNGNGKIRGQAYLITDGEGANFFNFFTGIVEKAGYRIWPRNFWIPRGIAYAMGSTSEAIAVLMRPIKRYQPKFSRFAVTYTCTDFLFGSERAKEHFGFTPKYSEEEAVERTAAYYRK